MKCKTLLLLSLVALALIPSPEDAGAAEKSAKLTTVRIGYVSRSILDMPFIIAATAVISAKRVWSLSLFS